MSEHLPAGWRLQINISIPKHPLEKRKWSIRFGRVNKTNVTRLLAGIFPEQLSNKQNGGDKASAEYECKKPV